MDDLEDQTVLLGEDVSVLQDSVADLQNTDVSFDERISNLESSSGGNNTGIVFIFWQVE